MKTLQIQLRLVEVNETPFNRQSLFEVQQRRQELPSTEKREKSNIPESLMLPKPVFFDLIKKKDAYSKYRDIVSNGSNSEAMIAKNRIIDSWKKSNPGVPLRRGPTEDHDVFSQFDNLFESSACDDLCLPDGDVEADGVEHVVNDDN